MFQKSSTVRSAKRRLLKGATAIWVFTFIHLTASFNIFNKHILLRPRDFEEAVQEPKWGHLKEGCVFERIFPSIRQCTRNNLGILSALWRFSQNSSMPSVLFYARLKIILTSLRTVVPPLRLPSLQTAGARCEERRESRNESGVCNGSNTHTLLKCCFASSAMERS